MVIFAFCLVGLIVYTGIAQQREITVADSTGDYIKDTDGNVWQIRFYGPFDQFDQHDLIIGSTILIRCGFWVSNSTNIEKAVFTGWVR